MSSTNPPANGLPVRRRPLPSVEDNRDARTLGMSAIRPIEYRGWTAFSRFCYNPDEGAFCSRTPKSWFLVLLYYACFLLCLFGFWFALMQVTLYLTPGVKFLSFLLIDIFFKLRFFRCIRFTLNAFSELKVLLKAKLKSFVLYHG